MPKLEGSFEVTSWDENPVEGLEDTAKVTAVAIGQRFTGDIEADTAANMVMTYREDGTADFVGYHRVQGRIGDKEGSFVFHASGGFDGTQARTNFDVVDGSGRGDFADVTGSGSSAAGHGSTGTYEFTLDL